jgi:Asp-tRNA(Asn)/Glu-tRNA(Gln) amidotransferase A subunit family amidase
VTARGEGLAATAGALRRGEMPLEAYLERLEAHFAAREPSLLAFVPEAGRFERLSREAGALLARYPDPAARPPLFGVPVGVKDIFHVDGLPTRAGSRLPAEALAGPEGPAVVALRQAGALILGKTVCTEFAHFAPGPTRNPADPEHTPGGSSSGSAAAVAAGLCPLALGTQTIGSIGRPASYCGAAGFKPSYDRIPRDGIIPLAPSLDHAGLFTADAEGAALAAGLLCRYWQPPGQGLHARNPKKPGKPVLGVPEGPYLAQASPEGLAHFDAVRERLAGAGYEVRPVAAMPDLEEIVARHWRIFAAEAARVHASWFERFGELYDPQTAELIARGRAVTGEELAEALPGREKLRGELTALMNENGLDLWISPAATGPAPRGLDSTGSPAMSLPWTHAGLPTLVIPAGESATGLPLGLQVTARWYGDEGLLAWGAEMVDREEIVVRA